MSTDRKLKRKKEYEERKSSGICVKCGKLPIKENLVSCEKCSIREAATLNKRRKKRIKSSVCEECGKDIFKNGLCETHYKHRQTLSKKITNLRLIRRENGLCETCGQPPLTDRKNRVCKTCETCYLKTTAKLHLGSAKLWETLKRLFDKQNVCPYTGINLVLGVNTSLDHITSLTTGGNTLVDNLQWVYFDRYGYFDVNRMKGALSHEQYKEAIRIQFEYLFNKN